MNKIIILSTDSTSGRGGISTSVRNCLEILEKYSIPFKQIPTHYPHLGRANNSLVFLKALVIVAATPSSRTIFYLHAGPKGSVIRKLILLSLIRIKKGQVYTHYHSPAFLNYIQKNGYWKKALSILAKFSSKNLCLNDYWKAIFEKELNSKFTSLPNPIQVLQPACGIIRANNKSKIYITCAARLVEEKNIQELIKLASLNSLIHLKIIGGGPYEKNLRELSNNSTAVNRITFTGWLDNLTVRNEIRNSDLFALPSKYDSFGMVYIESLAEGTPVIAPRLPPVIDTLSNLVGVTHADTAEEINEAIDKMQPYNRNEIQLSLIEKFGEDQYMRKLIEITRKNI